MDKIFTKKGVLFGFLLVAFIIVFEIILASLSLPAWPAFMVMIFFLWYTKTQNRGLLS